LLVVAGCASCLDNDFTFFDYHKNGAKLSICIRPFSTYSKAELLIHKGSHVVELLMRHVSFHDCDILG